MSFFNRFFLFYVFLLLGASTQLYCGEEFKQSLNDSFARFNIITLKRATDPVPNKLLCPHQLPDHALDEYIMARENGYTREAQQICRTFTHGIREQRPQ